MCSVNRVKFLGSPYLKLKKALPNTMQLFFERGTITLSALFQNALVPKILHFPDWDTHGITERRNGQRTDIHHVIFVFREE